ncbi:MAG: hypothetical protein J0L58_10540 [Burkholderiales bacterium]|nr:hypothetical protein [Burkholderiales bacterium]
MDSICAITTLPDMPPDERRALEERFPKKTPCSLAKFLAMRNMAPHDPDKWWKKKWGSHLIAGREHISPLSGTGTVMRLIHGPVLVGNGRVEQLPVAIQVDLNVPSYTVANNVAMGLSGYRAGEVALWAVSIELIRCGVPRHLVDKLTLANVKYYEVTLCFQRLLEELRVEDMVRWAYDTARHLGLHNRTFLPAKLESNWSAYIHGEDIVSLWYQKTKHKHAIYRNGDVQKRMRRLALEILRIDVRLSVQALDSLNLTQPEQWEHAHAKGTYRKILKGALRPLLVLPNGHPVRTIAPRPIDIKHLSKKAKSFLKHYLAGGLVDNWPGGELDRPTVLAELLTIGIDARMSWQRHKARIHSSKLKKLLEHRGDNVVPIDVHSDSFCKANWTAIKGRLEKAYAEARPEQLIDLKGSQWEVTPTSARPAGRARRAA